MNEAKIVPTPLLEITYRETGPKDAPTILLLHGWPDDATTWSTIGSVLAKNGFRTIAPWLRGFGRTVFRDPATPRTGNAGVLAIDAIALMDALAIENFIAVGHDWGSNIVEALAVGWPKRVKAIAQLSSPPRVGGVQTSPFWHAQLQWYHWFQATKRGAAAVRADHKGFAKIMWDNWSPKGWYTEEEFDRVANSWTSEDWAEVTIHSYRVRWDEADPDPSSLEIEEAIKQTKKLSLPALYIQGEQDGVNPPEVSAHVHEKFAGPFERILLPGVGHFPTREAPEVVADALLHFLESLSAQKT